MSSGVAKVLDEDAELGESLDQGRLNVVRGLARAATVSLERGEWSQQRWPTGLRAGLGLLVLDGLLLRRVELDGRFGSELLARGDVLRPWQREDAGASVPRRYGWWVLQPCRMALLDLDFANRIAPYPELQGALLARTVRRSRYLAIHMAIVHQPRVETRLHMLLWHLADRWGTVTPDGVQVPVKLTHSVLGELVAAQRPTVSAALRLLERERQITRTGAGWTLHGPAPGGEQAISAER
jgi:CRP/FNR family transcriptional regulator, cyclic AMP receptor protein